MVGLIISVIVGALCIGFGISHSKGNLSTLHSYHWKRVREADKLPFGRLVGAGTILIGGTLIAFGGLSLAADLLKNDAFMLVGIWIMLAGTAVGMGLSFYAMIKYNKGIF